MTRMVSQEFICPECGLVNSVDFKVGIPAKPEKGTALFACPGCEHPNYCEYVNTRPLVKPEGVLMAGRDDVAAKAWGLIE